MEVQRIVEKINEFLADIDHLDEDTAKDIEKLVIDKVGVLKIKISHDGIYNIKEYNKMRLQLIEGTIPDYVVLGDDIKKPSDIVPGFKIMLSTTRHKADFSVPVVRRCNGVMLHVGEYIDEKDNNRSYLKCNPMVIPANDLTTKIDKKVIDGHLKNGKYDIYMINDGTTVNIYYDENHIWNTIGDDEKQHYHKGKWMFSTKNASNVETMTWRGSTYGDVIREVLSKYPDFSLDKLDKNTTYTIGFKHPAHHPFGQPKEWVSGSDNDSSLHWIISAWFIQSYKIGDKEAIRDADIGLPLQKKHELSEFERDDSESHFQNILSDAHSSLQNYSRGYRINLAVEEKQPPPVFLGAFLRSKDESATGQFSDVLVESTLWVAIRHSIYQKPFIANKVLRDKQDQSFKNFTCVIVDAYLNFKKNKEFIMLFPQFQHYYDKMQSTIEAVTVAIFDDMQQRKSTRVLSDSEKFIFEKLIGTVKNTFQASDNKPHSGGPGNRGRGRGGPPTERGGHGSGISSLRVTLGDKKVIRDMITNPKYTEIYFEGLYDDSETEPKPEDDTN
jgi:hypothetical protein